MSKSQVIPPVNTAPAGRQRVVEWAAGVRLGAMQKVVLLVLALNADPESLSCSVGVKGLSSDCGMSESAAKVALRGLVLAGVLRVEATFGGSARGVNTYILLAPWGVA